MRLDCIQIIILDFPLKVKRCWSLSFDSSTSKEWLICVRGLLVMKQLLFRCITWLLQKTSWHVLFPMVVVVLNVLSNKRICSFLVNLYWFRKAWEFDNKSKVAHGRWEWQKDRNTGFRFDLLVFFAFREPWAFWWDKHQ